MMSLRDPRARLVGPAAFAVIALAIVVLSLVPMGAGSGVPGGDKLHHFVAYAALIFPIAFTSRSALIWALPLAFLLGVGIELVQPLTGRLREMADLVANTSGLAIGVALGLGLSWLWRRVSS